MAGSRRRTFSHAASFGSPPIVSHSPEPGSLAAGCRQLSHWPPGCGMDAVPVRVQTGCMLGWPGGRAPHPSTRNRRPAADLAWHLIRGRVGCFVSSVCVCVCSLHLPAAPLIERHPRTIRTAVAAGLERPSRHRQCRSVSASALAVLCRDATTTHRPPDSCCFTDTPIMHDNAKLRRPVKTWSPYVFGSERAAQIRAPDSPRRS